MNWNEDYAPDAFDVKVAELLVATADGSDVLIEDSVPEVLRLLRSKMNMDVVFVSEFTEGRREFRYVEQAPGEELISAGMSDPLEESWCQRVVDGRLPGLVRNAGDLQARGELPATPFPIGTHLSTPIVLSDGAVYGTLCCFSFGVNEKITERDMNKLRYTAGLTASKIDKSRHDQKVRDSQRMELQPMQDSGYSGFKGSL